MKSKRTKRRKYDGINVDEENANDTDRDSDIEEDGFDDEENLPSSTIDADDRSGALSRCHKKSIAYKLLRFVFFVLILVVGALLSATLFPLPSNQKTVTSDRDGNNNSTDSSHLSNVPIVESESETQTPTRSPFAGSQFFEHVLEWTEVPLEDVLSDEDIGSIGNISSNHFRATIEFCSDPGKELYGYGPVGKCVPGGPAPLIRMKPKRYYHLTLYNNAHIDTNMHTHGLHISGVGTVDDVMRVAKPGECLIYDHYILDDADVGTFWYHPHNHPHVTGSVYGGAYGMLIVDEIEAVIDQKFYPEHLANFLTRNEVLLQFSSMYLSVMGEETPSTSVRSNKINGRESLDLRLSPDTYYHFRTSSIVYSDSVNYVEFDPPDACDVRVVAYDGVYRSEIPGPLSIHKHMMTVGSRADFAVSCKKDAAIHFHQGHLTDISRLVTISLDKESEKEVSLSNAPNGTTVVSLPASLPSSPYWDLENTKTWKPRRPYYMPDLSASNNLVDAFWSVSMDDYTINGTMEHAMNDQVWDPHRSIRAFDLGQLVEYPILSSHEHPYHAHINRMQIVEPGGCGGRFEEGEYFDTISQSEGKPGGCTVRTKFFDFAGKVIIHCHRFDHEDHGMMAWIDILSTDGQQAPSAPATSCAALL